MDICIVFGVLAVALLCLLIFGRPGRAKTKTGKPRGVGEGKRTLIAIGGIIIGGLLWIIGATLEFFIKIIFGD
jgi:hypothetical protein